MTQDGRWVRPAYLSLAAVAGLIVLMWGLVIGALGGFHIYQPRYGRMDSDQGDVASAFNSVYSPLLQIGSTQGNVPPGARDQLNQAVAQAQADALQRAKDRGYNEAVKGALAFVVGGFVFLVGSSGAKRAGLRMSEPPAATGSAPNPVPASRGAMAGAAPAAVTTAPPRPQGRPVPVAPSRPTSAASSPVGRLQEPPDARKATRKPPPPPRPAPKRTTQEDPMAAPPSGSTSSEAPRPAAPPRPPAPAPQPPVARPPAPQPPVARPPAPAPQPPVARPPAPQPPSASRPIDEPRHETMEPSSSPPPPPFRPAGAPQPVSPPPVHPEELHGEGTGEPNEFE